MGTLPTLFSPLNKYLTRILLITQEHCLQCGGFHPVSGIERDGTSEWIKLTGSRQKDEPPILRPITPVHFYSGNRFGHGRVIADAIKLKQDKTLKILLRQLFGKRNHLFEILDIGVLNFSFEE